MDYRDQLPARFHVTPEEVSEVVGNNITFNVSLRTLKDNKPSKAVPVSANIRLTNDANWETVTIGNE